MGYCDFVHSEEGPRRKAEKGKEQMITSSILLNAMRNITGKPPLHDSSVHQPTHPRLLKMRQRLTSVFVWSLINTTAGMKQASIYRQHLNDIYVTRVREGEPNPSVREVIEGAMAYLDQDELDLPVGNRLHSDGTKASHTSGDLASLLVAAETDGNEAVSMDIPPCDGAPSCPAAGRPPLPP
jgi:hypothetical protein